MWGVQGVAQRQEPQYSPLACLLVHIYQTCLSFAPSLHTQFPRSTYTCPPPSQPLVHIHQPSFSLVSWFACPSFVLVCPSLRIPTFHSLLVCVHSASLFLASGSCLSAVSPASWVACMVGSVLVFVGLHYLVTLVGHSFTIVQLFLVLVCACLGSFILCWVYFRAP